MGRVMGPFKKNHPPTLASTIAPDTAIDFMIESVCFTWLLQCYLVQASKVDCV